MNNFTKMGVVNLVIAAMLSSACKKEANDTVQVKAAEPAQTATGIAASAGYRPEILGSITEPKGVYKRADLGPVPTSFNFENIYSVPMGDAGSITVMVNQKKFVYRLSNGDALFTTSRPVFLNVPGYIGGLVSIELTVIGVDKEQNSQISIRLTSIANYFILKEVSFKFDGTDAPGVTPSVVEYSSLYSNSGCIILKPQIELSGSTAKAKGVFYGMLAYRAGTWTDKSPILVSGSFNLDPLKI